MEETKGCCVFCFFFRLVRHFSFQDRGSQKLVTLPRKVLKKMKQAKLKVSQLDDSLCEKTLLCCLFVCPLEALTEQVCMCPLSPTPLAPPPFLHTHPQAIFF